MKIRLFLVFMLLPILASCAARPSPHADGALDPDTGITLAVQYPIIDKSCETLRVAITNNSDKSAEFGAAWSLERRTDDGWQVVPFRENVGFEAILYMLLPGGEQIRTIHFASLAKKLTDGEYRAVFEISDAYYSAPFTVGPSNITVKTPHGFAPIDSLPDEYSLADAAADGCVCIEHGELIAGADRFAEFLRWKGGAQLRIASLTFEGDVVLTDIVSDGDQFVYTRDASRDAWGGELFRGWYANLLTDGTALYLSNHGTIDDAARYVCEIPAEIAAKVREFTTYTLAAWSPDGTRAAFMRDGRAWVSLPGAGYVITPKYAKDLCELCWTADDTLLVIGRDEKNYVYEYLHIPAGNGMEEYISHFVSDTAPRWYDGELILPKK